MAKNRRERVALAITVRSPLERLLGFKQERGWRNLDIYSDLSGDYTRAYVSAEDGDVPGLSIFAREGGAIATSGVARSAARWPTRGRPARMSGP